MTTPQLVIVTNIPAPYRLHSFAVLYQELQRRNFGFQVMFMAPSETGRYWNVSETNWRFPGRISGGFHPRLFGFEMHTNPSIWFETLKIRPTWLLLGGSWTFPTVLGLVGMKFLLPHTRMLFWTEANYRAYRSSSLLVHKLRRHILQQAEGFVIPGDVARQTLVEHEKIPDAKLVVLPNLVDETIYRDRVHALRAQKQQLRRRYQIPEQQRVLFWPARLIEKQKGILNFLDATSSLMNPSVTIAVAGDGRDKHLIKQWIHDHPTCDVRLLGHISQDEVVHWLALSDALLLPSHRDHNPLSVIEAAWAALPLLISQNCGNWPELVHEGVNGWVVDPTNRDDMRDAFRSVIACSEEALKQMGLQSLSVAAQNFSSSNAAVRFLNSLTSQFPI